MSTFKKAQTLPEVAAQTIVEPLEPDDPRYVDLRGGRATTDLRHAISRGGAAAACET
jgi:hypothetical protein